LLVLLDLNRVIFNIRLQNHPWCSLHWRSPHARYGMLLFPQPSFGIGYGSHSCHCNQPWYC
jgi:hypothetical protein